MSAGKVMTIIFCNIQGVILNHFVSPKTTVTGNYYSTIKSELSPAIERIRPQLQRSEILLQYDNAPRHNSRVVFDIMKELDIELLGRPSYSQDLAI